jgi:hypothetical protein
MDAAVLLVGGKGSLCDGIDAGSADVDASRAATIRFMPGLFVNVRGDIAVGRYDGDFSARNVFLSSSFL